MMGVFSDKIPTMELMQRMDDRYQHLVPGQLMRGLTTMQLSTKMVQLTFTSVIGVYSNISDMTH